MLQIKQTNEAAFAQKAISANFIRQTNFVDKFKERNQKGNYFQEKEKKEIVEVNPLVSIFFYNLKFDLNIG